RQRKRCPLIPPFAQIEHFVQSQSLIEELPFVDQQSGVATLLLNCGDDLIEGDDLVLERRAEDAQREKGARQRPGHGYFEPRDLFRRVGRARDDDRAVALAYRSAAGKKRVAVGDVSVSVKAYRRYVVFATARA